MTPGPSAIQHAAPARGMSHSPGMFRKELIPYILYGGTSPLSIMSRSSAFPRLMTAWETRSRYLLNFVPVFLLLGVDGAQGAAGWLKRIVPVRRKV